MNNFSILTMCCVSSVISFAYMVINDSLFLPPLTSSVSVVFKLNLSTYKAKNHSTVISTVFLLPYTPHKGPCAYIDRRTKPMNKTNYKIFDVGYHYFHLFCVYRRVFSHQSRVLHCQF